MIQKKVITVTLPDIGEGVVEGEIIQWLKNVGDFVGQDEPVVVVMTDKATVELPSPKPGKLIKQHYKQGEIAHRDLPLYEIETEIEGQESEKLEKDVNFEKSEEPGLIIKESSVPPPILATPHTRQLAKELKVNIEKIHGSGKDGRVTNEDILLFQQQGERTTKHSLQRAAPEIIHSTPVLHLPQDEEKPLSGLRQIIAEKMVESKYIIPHFSFFDRLDASSLVQMKNKLREDEIYKGLNVSYMPFFIKALSLTLKKYPQLNGSVDLETNKTIVHKQHNIGVATKTPLGLLVFVVKNVENLSLHEVMIKYDELKQKGIENRLDRQDLQNSTITISNFGTLGGLWATPIINYPEIAILGIARIRKTPVVKQDQVVVGETLNLSWSFDHRVIDGDAAADCSNYYIELLENPFLLNST